MIKRICRGLNQCEGVAAVEFAMALPTLVFLLGGMMDIGLMLAQQNAVSTAADAGTLYAIVNANAAVPINSTFKSGIAAAVTNSNNVTNNIWGAVSANPAPNTFCGCPTGSRGAYSITQTTCANTCSGTSCSGALCTAGVYVTVNAQSNYKWLFTSLFSWATGSSHTLSATSTVRIQ
jgi:Flp pilus assembly protein TadG